MTELHRDGRRADELSERQIGAGAIGNAARREAAVRRIDEVRFRAAEVERIRQRPAHAVETEAIGVAFAALFEAAEGRLEVAVRSFEDGVDRRADVEAGEDAESVALA